MTSGQFTKRQPTTKDKDTGKSGTRRNEEDPDKKALFSNGMKAGQFYNRSGFASLLDGDIYQKNVEDYQRAVGSGVISMKANNGAGGAPPLNINGRIFYPNEFGDYIMIDRDYLEIRRKKAAEIEEYIDDLVELASASDDSLATILNLSEKDTLDICAVGGIDTGIEELNKVNSLPSILRLYPSKSLEFAKGVAKLRFILKKYAPIVESMGTKKSVAEEA